MKARIFGLVAALMLTLSAQAKATTVNFAFLNGATNVAEGSFSYTDGLTGVLGYNNLNSFSIHIDPTGNTFDLAFALAANTNNAYRRFGYDTASNQFVLTYVAGLEFYMGAYVDLNGPGFVIEHTFNGVPLSDVVSVSGYQFYPYDSISITAQTPLPAALPLFASGLGGLGLLGWRRKRNKVAARAAA